MDRQRGTFLGLAVGDVPPTEKGIGMSELDRSMIQAPGFDRPHVVILGAGSSYAAFPNGDKHGRQLPLMWNIVDVVGLGPLLDKAGIHEHRNDFEKLFSTLAISGKHDDLIVQIKQPVFDYFADLELPDEPTLYDHLVLSLRDKDVLATFNWDPFLWQALNRNAEKCPMPRALFLHGNTAIGYTEHRGQVLMGSLGRVSRQCGQKFESAPLLFPVTEKNYQQDKRIRSAWNDLKAELRDAFVVTVFGYSAPATDVEAVSLLKEGWESKPDRSLEEIEIVDIKSEEELSEKWSPFVYSHHYQTTSSFYDSIIGRSPRRSCEAMWAALMDRVPIHRNLIPQGKSWDELYAWLDVLLEDEGIKPCSRR